MRSHAEQIASKCVHFNGVRHDACKAGVNYADFRLDGRSIFDTFPCFSESGMKDKCDKCRFPTQEEIDNRVREAKESLERIKKARSAIVKHIQDSKLNTSTNIRGHVVCPACGKALHFTRAACNGHIWAKCETQKCTSWIE